MPGEARTSFDEQALISRVKARDEAALASLMEHHSPRVYSAAFRILKREPDAQEVTQDVFLALWRSPDRFDAGRGKLGTWLVILSRSRALDLMRNRQRDAAKNIDEVKHAHCATGLSDTRLRAETKLLVEEMIEFLPSEQAWAVRKVYFEGYTVHEAAAQCRTSLGTMKGRTRLALKKLRGRAGALTAPSNPPRN